MQRFALLVSLLFSCAYAQVRIDLVANLPHQDTVHRGTDVWGYVDATTGREYALLGTFETVSIVDITEPSAPEYVAFLDNVKGFDLKVWDHYAYSAGGNDLGPMDIIDLADPANPVKVGSVPDAHNIWIDEEGYLYAAFPGLRIWDLNANPVAPQLVYADTSLQGHDLVTFGDTLYFFDGYAGTFIYDVSSKSSPVLIGQIQDPQIQYAHSGWLTEDGKTLFICDELARTPTADISVWDISDFGNPTRIADFEDPNSIVHNIYIIGNYAYVSYYMNGFRIFDVTQPADFFLAAEFETFPDSSNENFGGAFGVYPYSPNGIIMVNDMTYGLFLFKVALPPDEENRDEALAWPNPFTDFTRIYYEIEQAGEISVEIFDTEGRLVNRLYEGPAEAGGRWFEWSGTNLSGWKVAPGHYYARLKGNDQLSVAKILYYGN